MDPHPDFIGVDLPRTLSLAPWQLTPLSPAQTEEDFAVVMASAPVLGEIFGDWPAGLTLEANRIDLAWHEREFTAGRSFAWILRDASGAYLGCFYIYPAIGRRGQADAVLWVKDMPDRLATAVAMKKALAAWLAGLLPACVQLTWQVSPAL